jgi:hypothetical protein
VRVLAEGMVCGLVAGQLGDSRVVLTKVSMYREILSMHCMTDLTLPARHGRVVLVRFKKLWSD